MPIDQKILAGIMNTDDSNEVIPINHHKSAFNIRFRGNAGNMRPETIPGTRQLTTTFPSGTNIPIGAFYDQVKQRQFWFYYNSNNNHFISIVDNLTWVVTQLLEVGAGTDGDILGFTLTRPIFNVNIIYGDSTQGDVLYWTNCQKQPCKINIDRQLAFGYGTVQRSFLDVIKAPFDIPPQAVYENDNSVTVNNLKKKLFKIKYRPIYDDNDKGVWSAESIVALPLNPFDTSVDADPTKNARISVVLQTGKSNVKKIEVAACQNLGVVFSDYFSVTVLDKSVLSIPNDDITIYHFYNNQAYNYIDLQESVQLFDLVPIYTNAQELLNGNVLIYGGITEGYNLLSSLGNTAVTASNVNNYRTQTTDLLFATQDGNTIGTAGDNIHIIVLGTVNASDVFNIYTTSNTITYTASGGDTTTDVINGLSTNATGQGFTVVSSDANNLVIHKTAQQLLRFTLTPDTTVQLGANDCTPVYDWSSQGAFAIQYFDKDGRTIGSQITNNLSFSTPAYSESGGVVQIPKLSLSIYHQPPDYAYYYSIGRAKDLSKSKILQWITDRTFKDTVEESDGNLYAWVSIENLNQYIKDKPSANFLAYDFAAGDRIRFIKLYPQGGMTTAQIETDKDFEIQAQVVNPIINGTQYQGQFLKIYLPATETGFDFGIQFHAPFLSDIDYSNYFIELYTPALSVAEGLDRYYEFGERYKIGNPTLSTRFHQGQLQNQSTDYVTPATFAFTQGWYYLRTRIINAAPEFKYTLIEQDVQELDFIPMDLAQTFNVTGYTAQSVPYGHLTGNLKDSDNWVINVTDGNAYTFNIKGNVVVKSTNSSSSGFDLKFFATKPDGTEVAQSVATGVAPIGAGHQYNFSIDASFTVGAGFTKMFFMFITPDTGFQAHIVSGDLTITDAARTFNQLCIDPNFSDSFQSAVNSNGRPFIFDANAKQAFFGNIYRWSLSYQPDTNINQTNRFFANNFDDIDLSKGDIQRFHSKDKIVQIFQNRGVGEVGVYAKFIQDSNGTSTLTTTDTIIAQNNVQYYEGEYGCGEHPEGICFSNNSTYFVDPIRGDQIRLANDGFTSVNRLYKGNYYIRQLLTKYNKSWTRSNGGTANILGCFDFFEQQYICVLQAGTNGSDSVDNYTFSFNEDRNAYCCFYDFHPDWILSSEELIVSGVNGNLYVHDDVVNYGKFYGTQFYPSIKLVFNDKDNIKKTFNAIAYQANAYWVSDSNGNINTSQLNEQTGMAQISQLKNVDYSLSEGLFYAAFLRDANSMSNAQLALVDGDVLKGVWIEIYLTCKTAGFTWLFLPYINYSISQRNY